MNLIFKTNYHATDFLYDFKILIGVIVMQIPSREGQGVGYKQKRPSDTDSPFDIYLLRDVYSLLTWFAREDLRFEAFFL
jgi:hypothetical protein